MYSLYLHMSQRIGICTCLADAMEMDKQEIYDDLLNKLYREHVFWSFDKSHINHIPDEIFIEKILIHLDIDDSIKLFKLFPKKLIHKIWKEKMLALEPMYHGLNRLYAFLYFKIKDPDRYIRENKNKLIARFSSTDKENL